MTTKHKPASPLPFTVVNGMVAIEHMRYLMDDRARLVEALRNACHGSADFFTLERGMELLRELGED